MGRTKNFLDIKYKRSYKKKKKKRKSIFNKKIIEQLFQPCENCPKNVRTSSLIKVPIKRYINPEETVLKNLCDECAEVAQKTQILPNSYCEFCEKFVEKPTRKCDTCDKFVCDLTMCSENLSCVHAKTTHTPALICHGCIKYCSYCGFRFCSNCFNEKNKKCIYCAL